MSARSTKPKYQLIKSILTKLGYYDVSKEGTASSKNVFLRKFWRFFKLYPSPFTFHFYFEHPCSFMAPKMYEYRYMLQTTNLRKEDTILDIGCGEGSLTFMLAGSVKKAIGVDILPSLIDAANLKYDEISDNVNTNFYCDRLENLGFDEESFEKIFSFSVIEHIPNYAEIFELIYKLLKPEGEMIISVDSFSHFDSDLRKLHETTFDVVKYFQKSELHNLLSELGFREITIEPIFTSKFSENWFRRVIKDPRENFESFKRLYSFFIYFLICFYERNSKQQEHGIFLVARCKK